MQLGAIVMVEAAPGALLKGPVGIIQAAAFASVTNTLSLISTHPPLSPAP